MTYINTESGAYPLSADDVKREHPGTSFPGDAACFEIAIARMGYAKVQQVQQPAVTYAQNITEGAPAEIGGTYQQAWVISDATAAEIAERTEAEATSVCQERNQRLSDCDWTQLQDAPDDAAAWAAYRQELRDVTAQAGFPWDVVWPGQS